MISPPRKWIKYRSGLSCELFVNLGSSSSTWDPLGLSPIPVMVCNSQDPYKPSFATTLIPGMGIPQDLLQMTFLLRQQLNSKPTWRIKILTRQVKRPKNKTLWCSNQLFLPRVATPPKPWICCWRWLLLWRLVTEILPWWITTIKPGFGNIGFWKNFPRHRFESQNSKRNGTGQAADATRRASRIFCVVTRGQIAQIWNLALGSVRMGKKRTWVDRIEVPFILTQPIHFLVGKLNYIQTVIQWSFWTRKDKIQDILRLTIPTRACSTKQMTWFFLRQLDFQSNLPSDRVITHLVNKASTRCVAFFFGTWKFMEIGFFSHPKVIVIVIEPYPLSNPRKNCIRMMTLTWGNQLSWLPCPLDPILKRTNRGFGSWDRPFEWGPIWSSARSMEKIMVAAPEGNVPFVWRPLCFNDLTQ